MGANAYPPVADTTAKHDGGARERGPLLLRPDDGEAHADKEWRHRPRPPRSERGDGGDADGHALGITGNRPPVDQSVRVDDLYRPGDPPQRQALAQRGEMYLPCTAVGMREARAGSARCPATAACPLLPSRTNRISSVSVRLTATRQPRRTRGCDCVTIQLDRSSRRISATTGTTTAVSPSEPILLLFCFRRVVRRRCHPPDVRATHLSIGALTFAQSDPLRRQHHGTLAGLPLHIARCTRLRLPPFVGDADGRREWPLEGSSGSERWPSGRWGPAPGPRTARVPMRRRVLHQP